MTKQDVLDGLYQLLLNGDGDVLEDILIVRKFEEVGIMSLHGGLLISMTDGSEYRLPLMKSE
jgi:hypothetical protein